MMNKARYPQEKSRALRVLQVRMTCGNQAAVVPDGGTEPDGENEEIVHPVTMKQGVASTHDEHHTKKCRAIPPVDESGAMYGEADVVTLLV